MELRDVVAVVTGAGGGIGRELVRGLLARGARVAAVDSDRGRLDEMVADVGGGDRVATFVVDITDREATAELPARVASALGPVGVLINNAGVIQPFVRVVDLDFEVIDRVVAINLGGTINMLKAFLPGLLQRRHAHVVNVSSMGGFLPVPGQAVYGAAKAGVKLLTEALYAELLDTTVGVTVVMPGGVATDITANSGVAVPGRDRAAEDGDGPSFPVTSPEDAAATILDGIVDGRLHVHVGLDSKVMSAARRVAPRQSIHLIQSQMKGLLEEPGT